MIIENTRNFNKKDLFYCYSQNLYKFLRFENEIEPIKFFENEENKKGCYIFVKSNRVKDCLKKWSENKIVKGGESD